MTELSLLILGDPSLDEDHQTLLQHILVLRAAPLPQARHALEVLLTHASAHFQDEDQTLRAHPSGNSKCHLDEHAAVLASLREVDEILAQPDADATSQTSLLDRLTAELLRWLPAHIHEMDTAVATQRIQSRFGGARVQFHRASALAATEQGLTG